MKANGAEVMAEKDNGMEEKLAAKDKSWNMRNQPSDQTVLIFQRLFANKILLPTSRVFLAIRLVNFSGCNFFSTEVSSLFFFVDVRGTGEFWLRG